MKNYILGFISVFLFAFAAPCLAFENQIDLGNYEISPRGSYSLNLADFPFDSKTSYSIFCIANSGQVDILIGLRTVYIFPIPDIYVNGDIVKDRIMIKGNFYNRISIPAINVRPQSQIKFSNFDQRSLLNVQCSAGIDFNL